MTNEPADPTGETIWTAPGVECHVVHPGDVIVLTFPDDTEPEAINDCAAALHQRYGFPILITDRTVRIEIERRR